MTLLWHTRGQNFGGTISCEIACEWTRQWCLDIVEC